MANTYELQTDTHLSKDFNKVLQGCMLACNNTKLQAESTPHYDLLMLYYGAVDTFFSNSFFLFETMNYKGESYPKAMMDIMKQIKDLMTRMRRFPQYRTAENYEEALELCNHLHMMIMSGLHQRNMLVRMSEREPKGARSIEHWDTKVAFKKGDLAYKTNEGGRYV